MTGRPSRAWLSRVDSVLRRMFLTWEGLAICATSAAFIFIAWLNVWGYKLLIPLIAFQGLIASDVIYRNLDSHDDHLVYSGLSILGDRGSRLGITKAWELVGRREEGDRGWIHGALYLASLGEREAIPLLIDSLGPDMPVGLRKSSVEHLRRLSGRNLGPSEAAWRRWWQQEQEDPG